MPMHESLPERVRHFVKQHQLFSCEDRVLVGLSGGADSVALFRILLGMKQKGRTEGFGVCAFQSPTPISSQ